MHCSPEVDGSMLSRFREAKREEIEQLLASPLPFPAPSARPSFGKALRRRRAEGRSALIAEYKRASPSRGRINGTLSPEDAARLYLESGAAALSVLTESRYFQGDIGFLDRMQPCGLPLLRKDFVFHPAQVAATARTAASALLVIVRMLGDGELGELMRACDSCGLEAVAEVFSAEDLDRARSHGARIVQVNNRDLDTLTVDFSASRELIRRRRPESSEIWISASGYERREQIEEMERAGFDAFLVGSSLMEASDPAEALRALTGGGGR